MKYFIGLSFIMLAVLTGCRQQTASTADVQFDISVAEADLSVGDAILTITLTDSNGDPITDATLEVRGDMNHAGMIPVIREVEGGSDDGTYDIPFEWTMGGDWIVTLTATLPDGSTATTEYDYTIDSNDDEMDVTGDAMEDMVATEEAADEDTAD